VPKRQQQHQFRGYRPVCADIRNDSPEDFDLPGTNKQLNQATDCSILTGPNPAIVVTRRIVKPVLGSHSNCCGNEEDAVSCKLSS
jgi:hypothetical protein